ncbi:MAG: NAD-dependent epimerase/dehydratase family protein [Holophagales bacterium]|nr:NAD-dependent epimerase/dehydratase family protein [Holophagales bacterium]
MAFRVLVAGGAGLVGSAVARQLLSEGAEVAVVDAMGDQGDGRTVRETRADSLRSFPKATVVTADLSLPGAASDVFRDLKPDAVVNAALFPPGGPGVVSMLEAMRSHDRPFLVHLSDGALYGAPATPGQPALEEEPIDPGSDPVLLQRMVEESRLRGSDVPNVILRLFHVLAPGAPPTRFPQDSLETLLDGGEVVLASDAPRDLLHVRDAVHGILAALALRPAGRTINLGSGRGVAPSHLVRLLAERAFRPVRIRVDEGLARPGRIASLSRAGELLRFQAKTSLETAAEEIVASRLGAPESTTSRPRPLAPLPRPTAPRPPAGDEPKEVSRRELFGFFRRPFDGGRPR